MSTAATLTLVAAMQASNGPDLPRRIPALLTRAARDLVRARLHVSLGAALAAWGWRPLVGPTPSLADMLVIFLVMNTVYMWNRLTDRAEDSFNCPADLTEALRKSGFIVFVAVGGALAAIGLAARSGNGWATLVVITVLFAGFAYSGPLRARPNTRRLKQVLLVKNLVPALTWPLLVLFYPAIQVGQYFTPLLAAAALFMFNTVFITEVVWDLRDVAGDLAARVRTIPQVLGPQATVGMLLAINALNGLLAVTAVITKLAPLVVSLALIHVVLQHIALAWGATRGAYGRLVSHAIILLHTVSIVVSGIVCRGLGALPEWSFLVR